MRVIIVVIVILLSMAGIFAKNSNMLNINTIAIHGEFQYVRAKQVKDIILQQNINRNFFAIDMQALVQSIQALPWIYQVSVAKIWPGKLIINFSEQKPLALWNDNGIITEGGAILYPNFLPKELLTANAIPKFFADTKQATFILEQYRKIQKKCSMIGLTLSSISVNKVKSVKIRLKNDVEVIFGSKDLQTRLNRFILAYDRELRQHNKLIKYIDLQYTNGFAVGWKSGIKRPKVGLVI